MEAVLEKRIKEEKQIKDEIVDLLFGKHEASFSDATEILINLSVELINEGVKACRKCKTANSPENKICWKCGSKL
jgi:hypothetical protein